MHFPPNWGGNHFFVPPKMGCFEKFWGGNLGGGNQAFGGKIWVFPPQNSGVLKRCFPPKLGGKHFWGGNEIFWGGETRNFGGEAKNFGGETPKSWEGSPFPPQFGGEIN